MTQEALMEPYTHITQMETIMVDHEKMLRELNRLLDTLDARQADYQALLDYYDSDQRNQDLRDDENHLIPQTLARGVLSEDEVFDLTEDYRDTALRMVEVALHMLKK